MTEGVPNFIRPTDGSFLEENENESGFAAYFDANIRPILGHIEERRLAELAELKRRKPWAVVLYIVVGVLFLVLTYLLAKAHLDSRLAGVLTVVAWALTAGWAYNPAWRYAKLEKEGVMPIAARFFGDVAYVPFGGISEETLKTSMLMPWGSILTSDTISGVFRSRRLSIGRVHISRHSGKKTKILFDGGFVEAELTRDSGSATLVLADNEVSPATWNGLKFEHVSLESPDFEKIFQVYGTDQVAARVFLAPDVMETLTALNADPPTHRLKCGLIGNRLYIALPAYPVLFRPHGITVSAFDVSELHDFLAHVHGILKLVDAFEVRIAK